MRKCAVFACPNRGVQWYLIDLETNVWLCEHCVNQAEQLVKKEAEAQRELVSAG